MKRAANQSGHRALLQAAVLLLSAGAASSARAQSSDIAGAESLFREGKERMAARDYVRACPAFAESFKLDPATGTLLSLAMCHERAGKVASAWAEYTDAAARSKREHRRDREKAAREKIAALEPRLSYLTVSLANVAGDTTGMEITRNGAPVGLASLGKPIPIDTGTYTIAVAAPSKKPWHTQVMVASSTERYTLTIPTLEEDAPPAPAPILAKSAPKPAPVPATPPPVLAPEPSTAPPQAELANGGGSGFGVLAAGTVVGGVTCVGIATAYLLKAMAKNEDSKSGCEGDRCTSAATQDRLDARAFGNVATIGFLAGGALLAMGTTIYIAGSPKPAAPAHPAAPARSSASLQASPLLGPGAFGGVLQGTF